MSNIEVVKVDVSDNMAKALRKLALQNEKHTASSLALNLMRQQVKARFKAFVENEASMLKRSYRAAIQSGFKIEETEEQFVSRQLTESKLILAELG